MAKRQLRAHLAWLPDKKRLERLHAKLGHTKTLDDTACELFAERAFFPKPTFDTSDVPRSKATFELAVQAAIRELPAAVAESTRLLTAILEKCEEVRASIAALRGDSLTPAMEDLKQQLTRMTPAGFWLDVPWAWLTHLPRYLAAMLLRSQKLTAGGAARDATNLKLVAPLYDRWHARRKQHQELRIVDPALETYRWMIEELRVSLFAQELGTSAPVSPQRLDKLWSAVRVG